MSTSQTCAFTCWTKSQGNIKIALELCGAKKKKIKQFWLLAFQVGMTTDEIDYLVHQEIIKHNAYPSPLRYGGFPKSVCTSVNNVLCHGIPDR